MTRWSERGICRDVQLLRDELLILGKWAGFSSRYGLCWTGNHG
jgi:hypothetical protein